MLRLPEGAGHTEARLPQEKADRAALEEEVRNLRHNNLRLLAQAEPGATRLLLDSEQLGMPPP